MILIPSYSLLMCIHTFLFVSVSSVEGIVINFFNLINVEVYSSCLSILYIS
jgi:hypothetical protein